MKGSLTMEHKKETYLLFVVSYGVVATHALFVRI